MGGKDAVQGLKSQAGMKGGQGYRLFVYGKKDIVKDDVDTLAEIKKVSRAYHAYFKLGSNGWNTREGDLSRLVANGRVQNLLKKIQEKEGDGDGNQADPIEEAKKKLSDLTKEADSTTDAKAKADLQKEIETLTAALKKVTDQQKKVADAQQ